MVAAAAAAEAATAAAAAAAVEEDEEAHMEDDDMAVFWGVIRCKISWKTRGREGENEGEGRRKKIGDEEER